MERDRAGSDPRPARAVGRRHPRETRRRVGRRLAAGVSTAERKELGRALEVTVRTLCNWRREAEGVPGGARRPGRPRRSPGERAWAKGRVRSALDRLGLAAGERTVHHELGGEVPLRLVRESLAELKAEHRARTRRAREQARTSTRVTARDAIWSLDATHLGRDEAGVAVVGEIVRDVASSRTLGAALGPPPTSASVVALLRHVVAEMNVLPFVLALDNGPENRGALEAWCESQGVVLLRNLPHTPQHNPWVEHGNGEIKAETGLGRGARVTDLDAAANRVVQALQRIDGARPRPSRGWKTARVAYAELPAAQALADRGRFLEEARCAIQGAVQDCRTARQRRLAERRAILTTLVDFGLIEQTRGRTPRDAAKAEDVL